MNNNNNNNSNNEYNQNNFPEDEFNYYLDLGIEYGNINYIKEAISKFKGKIDPNYIKIANNLILEIIQEKIEDVNI